MPSAAAAHAPHGQQRRQAGQPPGGVATPRADASAALQRALAAHVLASHCARLSSAACAMLQQAGAVQQRAVGEKCPLLG
jgi:hypothetical protein